MIDEELKEFVQRLLEADRAKFDRFIEAERIRTENLIEAERLKTQELIEADRVKTQELIEADRVKTDRLIKAMNEQMGELGRKFGGYTEGLALPAMKKILRQRFKMDVVTERSLAHKNGQSLELDMLGYSNKEYGDAYIVEIKSRFREDEFQQVLSTLREAPRFFPQLRDKRLYGIVVAVDIPQNMRRRVIKAGLYLALPQDDSFKLAVPRGFKPVAFYDGAHRQRNR